MFEEEVKSQEAEKIEVDSQVLQEQQNEIVIEHL